MAKRCGVWDGYVNICGCVVSHVGCATFYSFPVPIHRRRYTFV
jgi:hypothetical protein